MQVGGRGGRRRRDGTALVAPAPPLANDYPEHGPGPCPLWLLLHYDEHGHGPCPCHAPPAPPAPDVAGPSNWAGPVAMDVEPVTPPARPLTVAGLRRHQSRSPSTIAARRSAPARRIVTDPELTAPPPLPQPAAVPRRHVHASEAANCRPGLRRTWLRVPMETRRVASPTATPGQAAAAARTPPPMRTGPRPLAGLSMPWGRGLARALDSAGNGANR
jgi:hypothetical protein